MKQNSGCCPSSCLDVLLLGPRLIKASAESTVEVLKQTFGGEKGNYSCCEPSLQEYLRSLYAKCCDIPETQCPPRCVCCICWEGAAGDILHHHIQITNTGKEKRLFSLESIPFPCTEVAIDVSPAQKNLAPGQSLQAVASLKIPTDFSGSVYRTEILVKGAYEQCIKVHLQVKPRQDQCCYIEQGEIPERVRAQKWYHHFQCTEPCFEPADEAKKGGL